MMRRKFKMKKKEKFSKQKTIISVVLALLLIGMYFLVCKGNIASAAEDNNAIFAGGNGTEEKPYIIKTTVQLDAIRNNLSACYKIENDITFSASDFGKGGQFYNEGKRWKPIGTSEDPFCGVLDGSGYCISGLIINREDESDLGLFSDNAGEIKNLQISNFKITGKDICGGLTANNIGTILDCSNIGVFRVFGRKADVGVLCGGNYSGGKILRCFNSGEANAEGELAGIAYENYGDIEQCYNSAKLRGEWLCTGGIVCEGGGKILNCYNAGNIEGSRIGGIVAYGSCKISNCYNIGKMQSQSDSENIDTIAVGFQNRNNELVNCYSLDTIDKDNKQKGKIICGIKSMMQMNNYKGFDFEYVWEFGESDDYKFPKLRTVPNYAVAPKENTTDFAGGYGTKSSPYIIKDKIELNNIRKERNAFYKLNADITFNAEDFAPSGEFYNNGKGWDPIGDAGDEFYGVFNGNGHTIHGLQIVRDDEENIGLFGYAYGSVKNINLNDCSISGETNVGSIVGYLHGEILNCKTDGMVCASGSANRHDSYVGGITGCVGYGGRIENCHNESNVKGGATFTGQIGGITGGTIGGTIGAEILKSYNSGMLSCGQGGGRSSYLGGIEGCGNGVISECFNVGNVGDMTGYAVAGGIRGTNYGINKGGEIKNSYNFGEITSKEVVGGIIGSITAVTKIDSCYNTGSLTSSESRTGGIAGEMTSWSSGADIINCYNVGEATSGTYAGGIVGGISSKQGRLRITTCYNIGTISSALGNAGGIVGEEGATITDCFYLDNVSKGVGSGTDTATQCTAEQMQNAGTYGDAFDFEYDMIWSISDTAEYKFPILTEVVNPELQYTLSTDTKQGMPAAPVAVSYGSGKIAIAAISGQKYVCVLDTDKGNSGEIPAFSSSEWKSASGSTLVFSGLTQGKTYRVYTYIPAVGGQSASYVSPPLVVTLKAVGDLSGDGKIDSSDALYLRRAIAGWDGYELNFSAADINANEKMTVDDIMYLERHIAGWQGYETLPVQNPIS